MASKALTGVHPDGDVDWPLTYPLRKPIQAFDEEHSALTINEPTGAHAVEYSLLTRGLVDETVGPLLNKLTGIPEASLLRMSASDLIRLTKILGDFFAQAAGLQKP